MFIHRNQPWSGLLLALLAALIMTTACKKEAPPPVEKIRAIKTTTVRERASGHIRKFSGAIEAADSSSIGFEVPGNIQKILFDVGQKIAKGQTLAVLDDRTYKLDVQAAEAALGRAKVGLADKANDLDRVKRIVKIDPGAVSEKAIDSAKANHEGAQKNVEYSTSQLNLARRNREKTTLLAPFDGVIAERHVDRFQEVKRGQKVFDVYIEEVMEAAVSIPESEIEGIYLGLNAEIRFPTRPGQVFEGVVSEISSVAGTANAFPVKVAVQGSSEGIRPGMTAEVTILLAGESEQVSYLVPLVAIAPGDANARGYVFVYDSQTSTVKKTPVASDQADARDNHAVISKGVKAGDIIAVAGVSFLEDGQKVKLMER
jgi:RND family efflux transporter MFP subunit